MSENDEKDIMGDVISEISSAAEETPDTAEEAAQVFEEAAEEDASEEEASSEEEEAEEKTTADAETIVVKFDDDLEAARAVRVLNKALRKRHETIYQGAVVKREEGDEELQVEDLRDMGLADVITGTAVIGFDLGRDGFKLVKTTAAAGIGLILGGIRLLRRTALLAAGMGGSTWTLRRRRNLDSFHAQEEIDATATDLEPGETAVVIVADHETATELATELVRSGGELT